MPGAVRVRVPRQTASRKTRAGRTARQRQRGSRSRRCAGQRCAARKRSPVACQAVRACRRRTRACDRRVWSSGNQTVCNRRAAAQSARPGERWAGACRAARCDGVVQHERQTEDDTAICPPTIDRMRTRAVRAASADAGSAAAARRCCNPTSYRPHPRHQHERRQVRREDAVMRHAERISRSRAAAGVVLVEGFGTPGMAANVTRRRPASQRS